MRLNINAYLWSSVGFVSLCFMFSVSLRSLLGLWPLCLGNWCTLMKSQCCLVTTGLLNALPSKLRRLSITGWNVSVPNNYILKPCSCTCIINSLSITHQHPAEGAAVLNLAICIWFILHIHTSEGFHFKPNNLCYVFFLSLLCSSTMAHGVCVIFVSPVTTTDAIVSAEKFLQPLPFPSIGSSYHCSCFSIECLSVHILFFSFLVWKSQMGPSPMGPHNNLI